MEPIGPLFELDRFVIAQNHVLPDVLAELRDGRKRTHWMWFVFPQLRGLGHSAMAVRYGIASMAEGQAYLAHPILGDRLRDCTDLVLRIQNRSAHDIFGNPDDVKFHSSMTLFALADPGNAAFRHALDVYFNGTPETATLKAVS